jgi:hypothetical protein
MPHEPGRRFPLEPAPIHVPDEVLDDLRRRLELTRWPDDAGNQDWHYGVNRAYLQELVDYWRTGYDWRRAEAAINAYQHYRVQVEGVPVHIMRRPGVGPSPIPLILTTAGRGPSGTGPGSSTRWPTRPPTAATRPRRSTCSPPRSPASGSRPRCPTTRT